MQATDTSAIQRLIGRARFRIRSQWALEGATTATILAAATALIAIFTMRIDLVSRGTGIGMLIASVGMIIIGALVSASRKIDDEAVARRIDRASNLADRLSTAIAFDRTMGIATATADDETEELMIAAIKDGVRAVPRANIEAAAPFAEPKDLRAAAGFLLISALAAGLMIPRGNRDPSLFRATPDHARPGEVVHLIGENLLTGVASPVASLATRARNVIGAPGVTAESETTGFVPTDASVYLGPSDKARPVAVLDWTKTSIKIRIPDNAPIGDTILTAYIGKQAVGPVPFTVVDLKDTRYHKETAVLLDPDERAYVDAILDQLKAAGQRDEVPELEDFAKKIEQLLIDAEMGKITKEQLLDALAKAEEALKKDAEPNEAEVQKAMAEMGKELAKEPVTKELGEALQKNDLQKAKEEMEKLADKLDPKELGKKLEELKKQLENKDLTEQQKQDLQKKLDEMKNEKPLTEKEKEKLQQKLEQVSEQMEKKDKDQKAKQEQMQQKLENEIKRLQKKKDEAKTEKEQLEAERQLAKKKDELQKLNKDQDDKDQSAQRQALKRLQKDIEKAAENLEKPQKDPNKSKDEQDKEQEEREKQASRNMKDAARETGRVDQDQRKQSAQKKMSSQMDDLREAMRRAKQKGNKGPQDPFNKQGKNKDFQARARGQKGSGQAWKPGQGQGGQGQGQQPGGQGQGSGGKQWGTGTDDNLTGDATQKTGNTKDQELQGQQGSKGTSRRETILAAAQKGFAGVGYKKVYADYQRIVEEVMRTEKLPSSYKYYVKRYFAKIHPSTGQSTDEAVPAPATDSPGIKEQPTP
ncbi:MAG: hypothetical protein H0T42_27170 [Deltaproteobacteria bacterium]|nr:hypothetical protein [Deltaproteobacteria bacterium]